MHPLKSSGLPQSLVASPVAPPRPLVTGGGEDEGKACALELLSAGPLRF